MIDSEPLSRYDVKQETKIKYTRFTIDVNLTAEFEQCPFWSSQPCECAFVEYLCIIDAFRILMCILPYIIYVYWYIM